jgi:hypothetical protein
MWRWWERKRPGMIGGMIAGSYVTLYRSRAVTFKAYAPHG